MDGHNGKVERMVQEEVGETTGASHLGFLECLDFIRQVLAKRINMNQFMKLKEQLCGLKKVSFSNKETSQMAVAVHWWLILGWWSWRNKDIFWR